jgi:hypothetical protein
VALNLTLSQSIDARFRNKSQRWLMIDLESSMEPMPGKQAGIGGNGYFGLSEINF